MFHCIFKCLNIVFSKCFKCFIVSAYQMDNNPPKKFSAKEHMLSKGCYEPLGQPVPSSSDGRRRAAGPSLLAFARIISYSEFAGHPRGSITTAVVCNTIRSMHTKSNGALVNIGTSGMTLFCDFLYKRHELHVKTNFLTSANILGHQ
jgi:hypothetical protein